jgi:hypothetical protein
MFKKINGRCEIRYTNQILYLDYALTSTRFFEVFKAISNVLGPDTVVSIHKGKYIVPTEPLKLLSD